MFLLKLENRLCPKTKASQLKSSQINIYLSFCVSKMTASLVLVCSYILKQQHPNKKYFLNIGTKVILRQSEMIIKAGSICNLTVWCTRQCCHLRMNCQLLHWIIWYLRILELYGTAACPNLQENITKPVWVGPKNTYNCLCY